MKKSKKLYTLTFDIQIIGISKEIEADSIQDAAEKAKSLGADDVVDFVPAETNEHLIELTGVYK